MFGLFERHNAPVLEPEAKQSPEKTEAETHAGYPLDWDDVELLRQAREHTPVQPDIVVAPTKSPAAPVPVEPAPDLAVPHPVETYPVSQGPLQQPDELRQLKSLGGLPTSYHYELPGAASENRLLGFIKDRVSGIVSRVSGWGGNPRAEEAKDIAQMTQRQAEQQFSVATQRVEHRAGGILGRFRGWVEERQSQPIRNTIWQEMRDLQAQLGRASTIEQARLLRAKITEKTERHRQLTEQYLKQG